jgi:prephenate dehydrogenase
MSRGIFFDRVTVLGVGLIGASLALALKRHKLCGHICGFGRKEANLSKAKETGVIDSFFLDPARATDGSQLVVFSLPVGLFIETAKEIKTSLISGAVVTDVGSVKGGLVRRMEETFSGRAAFVGCHPIAGSEKSGIDTADADLFLGRKCIVTETEKTESSALNRIVDLWQSIGAKVEKMDPEEHDRVFGAVSHLPHVIAYEIMKTVNEIDSSYLGYAGRGFADITRIASSSPELWRDICLLNRENLVAFIEVFIERLKQVKSDIASGKAGVLKEEFEKAKSLRDGIGQD